MKLNTALERLEEEIAQDLALPSDVKVNVSDLTDLSDTLEEAQSVSKAATRLLKGPMQMDESDPAKGKSDQYQLLGKSLGSIVLKDAITGDFFPQSKKKGGGKKTKKTKKIKKKKNKKIKKTKKNKNIT